MSAGDEDCPFCICLRICTRQGQPTVGLIGLSAEDFPAREAHASHSLISDGLDVQLDLGAGYSVLILAERVLPFPVLNEDLVELGRSGPPAYIDIPLTSPAKSK